MQILLDSNIIIEQVEFNTIPAPNVHIGYLVSVITEAELLRYSGMGTQEMRAIEEWFMATEILPVTSAIARRAAHIGRTRKNKLPDLLIAATALEYDLALFTRNIKDFQRIPNLRIIKKL